MDDTTPALKLVNVSKSYGALHAVRQVSFEIRPGERRALIGPNGAGKTTLFHLISGMLGVSGGRIEFFGSDVTALPLNRRIALGMARTFQITNVFPGLTVIENVVLALQALEATKFSMLKPLCGYGALLQRARSLLDEWHLDHRSHCLANELSYGEQRTLEILLGIAQRPRLLLLDEPTAGLSPAETAAAAALIDKLPADVAILLIEHDMDVALQLCHSLTVLHLGVVLASGEREQIRNDARVQKIYLGDSMALENADAQAGRAIADGGRTA
jgi:branched-chain amino acid transport system ATP-binding protein